MKISKGEKKKSVPWSAVKKVLAGRDRGAVVNLVEELYSLNTENQTFILTRFGLIDTLEPYKEIIRRCVCPDWNKRLQLGEGRRAVNRYKKAVGEPEGLLELALYYVECGTKYTCEYGDIDAGFYESLVSMFNQALKILNGMDDPVKKRHMPRLRMLVEKAKNTGWGYHDYLADAVAEIDDFEDV